ncbi:hypothetical protein MMPV_001126 [Pyropia vietnamensis]
MPPSPPRDGGAVVVDPSPLSVNVTDAAAVAAAVDGVDDVVNLVGILHESRGVTFDGVHRGGTTAVANAFWDPTRRRSGAAEAVAAGGGLVHLSAIGADPASAAAYGRSKAAAEAAVRVAREAAPAVAPGRAYILRPSIVFGPEDAFFNRFASLARVLPFLPLVGGGRTRFQPVHVDDVAAAIVSCLYGGRAAGGGIALTPGPLEGGGGVEEGVWELGGGATLTFRELMELTLAVSGRRRALLPLPWSIAAAQGAAAEAAHALLPAIPPVITRDQVALLRSDNVVTGRAWPVALRPCDAASISYIAKGW